MNNMKKIMISSTLSVVLAASVLSGCGKHVNGTAAAISVNGEDINVGTANFILRYQQAGTTNMMQAYGFAGSELWDTKLDSDEEDETADASSASSEDAEAASSASSEDTEAASSASSAEAEEEHYATYGEQFKASVLETIEHAVVMRQHMADYGLTITDGQQAKIDEAAGQLYEENKDVAAKLGATEADVNQVVELLSYEYFMHDAMVEDMDREVSEEEAAQTTMTYARFATTTEDADSGESRDMTDEEKKEVEEKAVSLISQIKASDSIADADIPAMAKELDEDATGLQGSYGSDDTAYPDAVKEAAKSLQDGELYEEPIEADGYYYVVRMDKVFDEEMTESKKVSILNSRESEHIEEKVHEWIDASEIEVKEGWNALEVTDSDPYTVKITAAASDGADEEAAE